MPLVPAAGTTMEFWDQFGLCLLQETAQRLGKQLVVAIPSSLVIERDHEEIGVLKPLQHYLPVRQFCHRIGEGSIHAIEDAGVQEKGRKRRISPRRDDEVHLLWQVIQKKGESAMNSRILN